MKGHRFDGPTDMGSTFVVEPMHLSVTQTYATGTTSSLEVMEDADLSIGDQAKTLVEMATEGALVIALQVDEHHDEVRYTPEPGGGASGGSIEMLTRGIEVLTRALAAVRTTVPPRYGWSLSRVGAGLLPPRLRPASRLDYMTTPCPQCGFDRLDSDYSVEDVAKALQMSERWVRDRVRVDGIAHQRYGHVIRFTEKQVANLRAAHAQSARPAPTQRITTGPAKGRR